MYQLLFTERFKRNYKKIVGKDKELQDKVVLILENVATEPFQTKLRTHKVNAKEIGWAWSTRVTGDIRIIWIFSKSLKNTLEILNIGTHSGQRKVYS